MDIFESIKGLVSGKSSVIKTLLVMIKLEARLAGDSILPFLLNVCMIFGVLITLWLLTMLLLGYVLMLAFDNKLYPLLIIWVLNIAVFVGLLKYLQFNLGNMSFEKTRNYFSKKRKNYENIEKTINNSPCDDGKNITTSTVDHAET